MAEPARRWGGTTLEDRRAQRREQLLEAGVEVLGTAGAEGFTVRAVLRAAGLSERYFYESFDDRDALLVAVHDRVAAQARDVLAAAVAEHGRRDPALAETAVRAFTGFLEEDRRRARVLLSESLTDAALARNDLALLPVFAALLAEQIRGLELAPRPDATDARLTSVALIGALRLLYLEWLDGEGRVSTQRLNRHATRLILAAAGVSSRTR